jgi:lysophospholipase L1-like esterase
MSGARFLAVAVLAMVVAGFATPARPVKAQPADACAVPPDLLASTRDLPHAARAVRDRKALRVLVVGTASSTMGGTSSRDAGYPAKLQAALHAGLPGVAVLVQTRGGRGLTTAELGLVVAEGLAEFAPDVVLWQTGTVDAVRGIDPDGFAVDLQAGVERAAAAGTDLVLIDPQFSRTARATLNLAPYRAAMEAVAASSDAALFRRYELMRHWAEAGLIDLERAPRSDWRRLADQLHACLGKALAENLLDGIRQAR